MASDKDQLQFVLDQLEAAGDVTAKSMFGEYGVYCDGKIVALFCDDQLYLKPTAGGRAFLGEVVAAPPYPGAKPYFLIGDEIEDRERLCELVRITARELPAPKPRKRRS